MKNTLRRMSDVQLHKERRRMYYAITNCGDRGGDPTEYFRDRLADIAEEFSRRKKQSATTKGISRG